MQHAAVQCIGRLALPLMQRGTASHGVPLPPLPAARGLNLHSHIQSFFLLKFHHDISPPEASLSPPPPPQIGRRGVLVALFVLRVLRCFSFNVLQCNVLRGLNASHACLSAHVPLCFLGFLLHPSSLLPSV